MKKFRLAAAICLVAGVALFLFFHSNKTAPSPAEPIAVNHSLAASATSSAPAAAAATAANSPVPDSIAAQRQNPASQAGELVADTNAPANLSPEIVLQNIRRAVREYGEMFGGNPVGTNPEITAALAGKNAKQINFLNGQPGTRINQNGELVDPWGTPYFFDQPSGTVMEIHSAGPDKIMWTSDDLVTE